MESRCRFRVANCSRHRPIHRMNFRMLSLAVGLAALLAAPAQSDRITVAVATNFLTTAQDISRIFTAETGHEVVLVHGSSGKLYAQIVAGAPYDVFLSADMDRPARLASDGLLADGSPKPYAIGRLALVHLDAALPESLDDILTRQDLRIAIADPAVAPYGSAARSVLQSFRGSDWNRGVVLGESVAQAFAFVATGNADAGLVALSLALAHADRNHYTEVSDAHYGMIRQDAALLMASGANQAARAFYAFLDHPAATEIMAMAGYGVP